MQVGTGILQIGNNTFNEAFIGLIDEVYIYNYARTITEIQTDMNTNSASSTNFYVSNGNGTSTKLGAGGSILLGQ
jgi:hypothetical protein